MVACNTLPETNELVSPNAGGAAECAGAAGAVGEAEGTSGVETGGAGGVESAGIGLLVVADVLVDAAGDALGFETISTKKSFSLIAHDSMLLPSGKTLPE